MRVSQVRRRGGRRIAMFAALLLVGALVGGPAQAAEATSTARVDDALPATVLATTTMQGGQAIYSTAGRCSLGFNVHFGTTYYFITSGWCTSLVANWYADSALTIPIGTSTAYSFPSNDFGIVKYTNPNVIHPSSVYLYPGSQSILSTGNGYVGQTVSFSGAGGGLRQGTILATNATVFYPQAGSVYGLIKTNICVQPGDTGGALFSGSVAIAIFSGFSGTCGSGGASYFQPVREVLSMYGLSIP